MMKIWFVSLLWRCESTLSVVSTLEFMMQGAKVQYLSLSLSEYDFNISTLCYTTQHDAFVVFFFFQTLKHFDLLFPLAIYIFTHFVTIIDKMKFLFYDLKIT